MKYLILILLCGCAGPSITRIDIERMSDKLGANNASFRLEIPTSHGTVIVSRANPTLGINANVTGDGVSVSSPTNVQVQIKYDVQTPPPTLPKNQTNP